SQYERDSQDEMDSQNEMDSQDEMDSQYERDSQYESDLHDEIEQMGTLDEIGMLDEIGILEDDYVMEEDDNIGVKRHGATSGCRTCLVSRDNLTDENLDIANVFRYHHITNTQFEDIFAAPTITQQNDIFKRYGLQKCFPILDELQREQHLQSPQDIYHIMAGKTLKLLKLTVAILSLVGEQRFLRVWRSFEYPQQWSKLPNPISHIE
ncbi:17405_t:CDS:2, partial [Racocetra fulgida]